jgi:hypothetical protein
VVTAVTSAAQDVNGSPANAWRDVPVEQLLENQGWVD